MDIHYWGILYKWQTLPDYKFNVGALRELTEKMFRWWINLIATVIIAELNCIKFVGIICKRLCHCLLNARGVSKRQNDEKAWEIFFPFAHIRIVCPCKCVIFFWGGRTYKLTFTTTDTLWEKLFDLVFYFIKYSNNNEFLKVV